LTAPLAFVLVPLTNVWVGAWVTCAMAGTATASTSASIAATIINFLNFFSPSCS
jgi:hypothetical protein